MKEYRLFDISDFVMDEDFIRWVNKREKADNDFWNNWLRQHPDKHMVVAEARRVLESIGTEQTTLPEHEIQAEIDRLLFTIKEQEELPSIAPKTASSKKWWYAVAATVMMALAGTAVFVLHNGRNSAKKYSYETISLLFNYFIFKITSLFVDIRNKNIKWHVKMNMIIYLKVNFTIFDI